MKLIYVCSPYAGDIPKNTENARKYCAEVVKTGNIPFAPHLLFPQFMDDSKPEEREKAMMMGLKMLRKCDEVWIWGEERSSGMIKELQFASVLDIPVHYGRSIP